MSSPSIEVQDLTKRFSLGRVALEGAAKDLSREAIAAAYFGV